MLDTYVALQFHAKSPAPYLLSVFRSCDSSLNVQFPFLVERVYGKASLLVKVPHADLVLAGMSLPCSFRQPTLSLVGDAVRQSLELRTRMLPLPV